MRITTKDYVHQISVDDSIRIFYYHRLSAEQSWKDSKSNDFGIYLESYYNFYNKVVKRNTSEVNK